jgi:predicted signal transduction protein with EAL and GGDEF domain
MEDIENTAHVVQVAERIQDALATPFMLDGHQMVIEVSIGIAVARTGGEEPDDLLRNADIAMYQAKTAAHGGHVLFDPAMHTQALARLQLECDLRHAMAREEFVLHYQPIEHLEHGTISAVEALVRWQHPERGMIPPDVFIPVAEESGLIVPLGALILRLACGQMAAWKAEGVMLDYVSVNLSVQQLHQRDVAATIRVILDETGLVPSSLAIEVTESGMMEDVPLATAILGQLREIGVRVITIDDFGTGYASLSYLQQLPVTHIKIDQSFVHDITTNVSNETLVRTMIAMAHGLNLKTIAEGVETEDQRHLLQSYGCDALQGYLINRPLPADALIRWLRK